MKNINFLPRKVDGVKSNFEKNELEIEKLRLETSKLIVELQKLRRPWYMLFTSWTALFPVIITIIAAVTGYATGFFNNQKILNQIEAHELEIRKDTLEEFVNKQLAQVEKIKR